MENILSLTKQIEWTRERTRLMRSLNVVDDSFYVWHSGRSATINGFRISRGVNERVNNWNEVNAALGQLLMLLATTPTFENQTTELLPLGSTSKIAKAPDRTQYGQFPLFTDDSFSILPKRNFNTALSLLLRHIHEWHIKMSASDPSIQFPYAIENNGAKIAGLPIAYHSNDVAWTLVMKLLFINIKWIAAWLVKQQRAVPSHNINIDTKLLSSSSTTSTPLQQVGGGTGVTMPGRKSTTPPHSSS